MTEPVTTDTMTTNTVPATEAQPTVEQPIDLVSDDESSLEEGEVRESRPAPTVAIPTLDDHRGRGILAGTFVKPDPAMTRQETRRYVVAEMRRWLTESSIAAHAREICAVVAEPAEVAPLVAAGRWPAARLDLVLAALEAMPRGIVELPRDYEERFDAAARWAADVCEDYLHGYEAVIPAARMAVGFVTDDQLPGGQTIASYWNYSPFEALRSAPPLSDSDPPEEEPEPVQELTAESILSTEFTIRFTGGQALAVSRASRRTCG
jgi:hypothetical protein